MYRITMYRDAYRIVKFLPIPSPKTQAVFFNLMAIFFLLKNLFNLTFQSIFLCLTHFTHALGSNH